MFRTLRFASIFLTAVLLAAVAALAQAPTPQSVPEPNSSLDAELFYQLLLGELNAMGGEPALGFQLILDAARKTADPRLYRRATDIALQGRSGDSALQATRAWRQAIPASREANRYLLQILIGMNRLPEVLEPLKRDLAASDPAERLASVGNLPRLFARATDKKVALNIVELSLADYLANPELGAAAWTTIGRMRLDASDLAGALDAAQRGQAIEAGAPGPAILALSLMDPKLPQAEAIVKKYLDGRPRIEIRMDYARALLSRHRHMESAAQLNQITSEKPDYAQAWLVKGLLEMQNKESATAEKSLRQFVQLESASPAAPADSEDARRALTQAYVALAEIAEKGKDYANAKSWLDRIDDTQEMAAVQVRRAALLARQGRLAEGRALLQALPEGTSSEARAKISAEVQLLRDNKQYQAAYDILRAALITNPEDLDFLYDQAMIAEKLGRPDEMERLLRQAIASKPDYHHAYNALGYSLADRNMRLPEARQLILKALEYAPGDPYISDSLAWVEFRSGNLLEALRILRQAYTEKPDAEIAAHLGEVLWAVGERSQAMTIWKEGIEMNADNETLLETLKRLHVRL
jgi:tetratricopeptide (TPR) repeat protein